MAMSEAVFIPQRYSLQVIFSNVKETPSLYGDNSLTEVTHRTDADGLVAVWASLLFVV